jgi:hypothetical protein
MMQRIAWLLLAAVHFLPALALFRPSGLTALYGIKPDNPLYLLMHHRAALFFAVFVACVVAAIDPGSRRLASVVTGISMIAFLLLWWRAGSPAALKTIAVVDLVGLPVLIFAALSAFRLIGR